ncbi:hypothetical protein MINT15_04100 [Saccharomonospora viridis]|uniref:Uncharacterized protein n=1 Tax=Saccharomonospora viridis TaxID=1852 RepID=A0A837DDU9_9PSEU|nr:hypothetical protein MINT15_04100 [Saccharomonospora viridis]
MLLHPHGHLQYLTGDGDGEFQELLGQTTRPLGRCDGQAGGYPERERDMFHVSKPAAHPPSRPTGSGRHVPAFPP